MFHRTSLSLVSITIFIVAVLAMVLSLWWRAPARIAAVFRTIGLATYPLYLLHDLVGVILIRALTELGCGRFVALIGAIAFALGASLLIAIRIEPFVREWLRRILDRLRETASREVVLERG
jgi:peptidoglycan/LPS O-acetylase OafA/YrhL